MKIQKGNALTLGPYGILIIGPVNSGKSALSLALIERSASFCRSAFLVADDYVSLSKEKNQIFAHTPQQIAGAIEIRGAGLFQMDFVPQTHLDLVVELEPTGERYPQNIFFNILDVPIALLKLPQLGIADSLPLCHAIEAYLFKKIWHPDFSKKRGIPHIN